MYLKLVEVLKKLEDLVQVNTNTLSMDDLQVLCHTTLDIFQKLSTTLLSAFYKYRAQADVHAKIVLLNKGTVA